MIIKIKVLKCEGDVFDCLNELVRVGTIEIVQAKKKPVTAGTEVWQAYEEAYRLRYGVQPIRNSKTNSVCKKLIDSVGKDNAINVVTNYLRINDRWYINKAHDISLCISDYQKILTCIETGVHINSSLANQIDKKQATSDAIDRGYEIYKKIKSGEIKIEKGC